MNRTWPYLLGIGVLILTVLTVIALRKAPDKRLAGRNKVVFQLQWEPGAQFIGFYVARANNYYAEEGLTVEFLNGGPSIDSIRSLTDGNAQIGLATADQVLIWNDKNKDPSRTLKAVGTVFNKSLARFMSRKSAPIRTPQDFVGKTVGVYPLFDTDSLLRSLLQRNQIDPSKVKIIEFPSIANFHDGTIDAFPSYVINEPVWAKQNSIDVELLDPAEFGVTFYSDTIITTQQFSREQSDILERFVRASARGWAFAESNTDDALRLMSKEIGGAVGEGKPWEKQVGAAHEAVRHLRGGPNRTMFFMEHTRWQEMEKALFELQRVSRRGVVDDLCDFDFVQKALNK
jgi:NitT/TauT family transport system substrate-binding protein